MQPTPGNPGFWGWLWGKLKTEHIAVGQNVLETFSRHSILKRPCCAQAWGAQGGGQPGASCWEFLQCQQTREEKFQGFILLSQGSYNSAYPAEFLLIHTSTMRGELCFSYLFGEVT